VNQQPAPEPGQIWADNDPRCEGRQVRITAVDGTHATVELIATRDRPLLTGQKPAPIGRQTRILLRRFKPTSTGYRLVANADGTSAA
jgi:hypothetical protein